MCTTVTYHKVLTFHGKHVPIFVVVSLKSVTNPVKALQSCLYSSAYHLQCYITGNTLVLMNFLIFQQISFGRKCVVVFMNEYVFMCQQVKN